MSETQSIIQQLTDAIKAKKEIALLEEDRATQTQAINRAAFVKVDQTVLDINADTDYKINDTTALSLRDVVFCWLHKDTPSSEYIQAANTEHVTSLTFAQRTRLVSVLSDADSGAAQARSAADAEAASTEPEAKRQKIDPAYEAVKSHEREVANDYRGQDDFSYLIKLSQVKIIEQLKGKSTSSSSRSGARSGTSSGSSRPGSSSGSSVNAQDRAKDPIIILSPAASSILNLSNVAKFLQDSVYEPATITTNSNGVVKIKKQTKFGPVSFLLIDNTDKFFNKPDYWRRVVAIFTTGQKWQFKNYQVSNPSELFRTYPGFYVNHGEPVPKHVKEWGNVNHLAIDKYKRFRDKQAVEAFWGTVERYMAYRGYGGARN